jgi:hypothetical protein
MGRIFGRVFTGQLDIWIDKQKIASCPRIGTWHHTKGKLLHSIFQSSLGSRERTETTPLRYQRRWRFHVTKRESYLSRSLSLNMPPSAFEKSAAFAQRTDGTHSISKAVSTGNELLINIPYKHSEIITYQSNQTENSKLLKRNHY